MTEHAPFSHIHELYEFLRTEKLLDRFFEWRIARNKKLWKERPTPALSSQNNRSEAT